MTKKHRSTYDEFLASMTEQQKKEFEQEYQDLLIDEMIIALMEQDNVSVRKLAQAAKLSPTIIQGVKAGTRKNVSAASLFKMLRGLGCKIIVEKDGQQFPIKLKS